MPIESEWQEALAEAVRKIGFSYEPTAKDVHDYIKFAREYEHDPKNIISDEDVFPVTGLSQRWEYPLNDLLRKLPYVLPIYVFHKNSKRLVRVNDQIESAIEKLNKPKKAQVEGNISFAFPWFWVVSMRELQFLERLPRRRGSVWPPNLIFNQDLEPSFEWITWDEILERWNIKNRRLEDFILDLGLAAYTLSTHNGIEAAPEDIILKRGQRADWFPREHHVLFAREDVWAFEEKYGSAKDRRGKSPRAILRVNPVKLRAIDIIREGLRSDPHMTQTRAVTRVREKEPTMFGPLYPNDRTIKRYTKGLPLNRRAGRPKKIEPHS